MTRVIFVNRHEFGNAEIHQLDSEWLTLEYEDVARLEISMHDSDCMRRVQSGTDLIEVVIDVFNIEPLLGFHQSGKIAASQQLHDVVKTTLELAIVEDSDNIRILKAGRDARLVEEASRGVCWALRVLIDEFYGSLAAEGPISRYEHGSHATVCERPLDDVVANALADHFNTSASVQMPGQPDSLRTAWQESEIHADLDGDCFIIGKMGTCLHAAGTAYQSAS